MARKHIADMIRQEAQNFPEAEGEPHQEAIAEERIEEDAEQTSEITPSKHTQKTKAELEASVIELSGALEQAHQKESSLQQQITDLKLDLQKQEVLVQKLQKDLEQANRKKEFEEAKKTALQLAEANSKLIEEVSVLKKEKEDVKAKNYKKVESSKINYAPEPTKQPADFAANSWLL
ncbi:MAG: hypothetical protein NVS2B14_10620 [Chamaesiphon sp.]